MRDMMTASAVAAWRSVTQRQHGELEAAPTPVQVRSSAQPTSSRRWRRRHGHAAVCRACDELD